MDAPGLEAGTKTAAEQGKRAADAMQDGDAMSAEGGARAAEAGLEEAQRALEQAKQDMQSMARESRGQSSGKDKKGEGDQPKDGDDGGAEDGEIALPTPESFRTPEEYRKALLEGMEGDVPEEYKALNRRYYEELVRQ
jgi:hypothetical protein